MYIRQFHVHDRLQVQQLDMWKEPFPQGDTFFFGDIFHDWDESHCFILAKKCYHSLSKGGKILLHEMLFCEDKTGPFLTAAYNMKMLLWTQGRQYSFREIQNILHRTGFKKIQQMKGLGNWSLVMGEK